MHTYQHSWGGYTGVVKSLTPRWSLGGTANASSSVQSNQDFFLRAGPALEFDLFPYAQSTRRQVVFRYTPGIRVANYTEYTIYDKLKETHPDHQFLIGAEMTPKWGSVSASTTYSALLDDLSKYGLDLNGYLSWRIRTGLNLNFGGGYARIRNQLNLKRGKQEQQVSTPAIAAVTHGIQLLRQCRIELHVWLNFPERGESTNVDEQFLLIAKNGTALKAVPWHCLARFQ